jgi:hypothetical protein
MCRRRNTLRLRFASPTQTTQNLTFDVRLNTFGLKLRFLRKCLKLVDPFPALFFERAGH